MPDVNDAPPPPPAKSPDPGLLRRPINPVRIRSVIATFFGMILGAFSCWVLVVFIIIVGGHDRDSSFLYVSIVAVGLLGAFVRLKPPTRALGTGVIIACIGLLVLLVIVD